MKLCLFLISLALSCNAISQSVCGTSDEGGSVTLTAPAGKVFTSVTFASYGTPNGSCGSFTLGGCNATNSKSIVEAALLNQNSATISASNTVFGDPCGGTFKRLYIEAVYGTSLPLHLISFSCSGNEQSNVLKWQTSDEVNTQSFDVQRSVDGIHFSTIGNVASLNNNANNFYSYTDHAVSNQTCFYRLKMIDRDGSFTYSTILKAETRMVGMLTASPNPVVDYASVSGLNTKGYLEILTLQGASIKRITVTGNTQIIDLTSYPAGMYVLKYSTGENTWYQKIVKQ